MTPKDLRTAWDFAVEANLHPKLQALGFARHGKGWTRKALTEDKQAFITFERTCCKKHLCITCGSEVWIRYRRQDDHGWATGTLAGEVEPVSWNVTDLPSLHAALRQAEAYVLDLAVPEAERILTSGTPNHAGVRVGRLDELTSPPSQES